MRSALLGPTCRHIVKMKRGRVGAEVVKNTATQNTNTHTRIITNTATAATTATTTTTPQWTTKSMKTRSQALLNDVWILDSGSTKGRILAART